MDLFKALAECFGITNEYKKTPVSEKAYSRLHAVHHRPAETVASDILTILVGAENKGPKLEGKLQDTVGECGWNESIAKAVWNGLIDILNNFTLLGGAMLEASKRAMDEATEFACDHPAYTALLALGILVILAPWTIEALGFWVGFGEEGPIEGSLAAMWQSRYAGYVPKRSLFSYFQSLGMTWSK